jgi:Tfp pilus assembly protein PilF
LRIYSFIALLIGLFWGTVDGFAQKKNTYSSNIRAVEFLVRNGDYIKNIAAKIKVPAHDIVRINKLGTKNYLAYPGLKLLIPVRVQPKVWDPTREDMSGNSPSKEDRGGSIDYDLVIDSTNYKLEEDLINLKEAKDDSVEYENIEGHLRKIDRRISYLSYKIDSIKQVDFKFDYEDQDKNSVLAKVKMSRDKFYSEGPIGRQLDSLKQIKTWLGQRRIILRNQVTEYEYLVENAGYSEKNFRHEEKEKPSSWGDHLAYESQYVKSKAEASAKSDNTKPTAAATKAKAKDKTTDDLVKNETISSAKTENPAPKTDYEKMKLLESDDINFMDTASDVGDVEHHYKSDFAAVPKQKFTTEITTNTQRGLWMKGFNPSSLSQAPAPSLATTKEAPKAKTNPGQAAESPLVEAEPIATKEVSAKPHDKADIPETANKSISALATSEEPAIKLDTKLDTTTEKKIKKTDTDPLAKYKSEDSGFVAKSGQIKSIPIAEYKNKPKYMVPVDSVTRIKGEFYVIRARQSLEKGDFKNGDKYLRKSLDINPNNAQAWMLHADLFLAMGLADQSLKEYIISSEIDSTNPKIFYNIALLYTKANNSQRAYKYFSKAIEVSDKYLLAYMGRASLQMDERDYEGAVKDYDKVLSSNKYYSPAFKARGLAKMELRKFAEAIADFNQYLEIEDPDGYVVYQRGISKIYNNSLLQGCLDLSSAQELGFKDAEKAIKKFCE